MPRLGSPQPFIHRLIKFPKKGLFSDVYVRLKKYHADQLTEREQKPTSEEMIFELLDEALTQKGY